MKLLLLIILVAVLYGGWFYRRIGAKTRLRDIDAGRRCIACDGTRLERRDGFARCLRCGHVVALAALRAAHVADFEVKDITRPEDRGL